ncbi:MAG: diguanylate cyclase protein [Burkholderiaceae bacterium]|nr:diguanylate cyclase protein [Burkholderiaceae bacterium]
MYLILKYEGQYPPEVWADTGAERIARTLWRFHIAGGIGLDQLLGRLAAVTDSQTLRDTLALKVASQSSSLALEALESAMPFNAMYARYRYPWMLGPLEERLEIHFQPVVDMQSGGQIFAYEALCRLRDPSGSLLSGSQAFTLAHQLRRRDDMDIACQLLALKRKAEEIPAGVPLFLNVMPTTLLHGSWAAQCIEWLHAFGIEPRDVIVEVVESERVDAAMLSARCEALRAAGLRIALDDMGAGFNGLATLAMVRADFIKIDRALVHEAQGSRVRGVLLDALVSMSERLGAAVIAEGLERAEDIGFCRSMGIGLGQGNFFSPPQPDVHAHQISMPELDDAWRARPQDRFRLNDLVEPGRSIELHSSIDDARQMFEDNPSLPWLVVLDQGYPLGLLARGQVMQRSARKIGMACEPIKRVVSNTISLSSLARSLYLTRDGIDPWVVTGSDGQYVGTVQPMNLVAQILTHREHGTNLHPLSQLPTGPSLRQSIEKRLAGSRRMKLVYIDLDHFKAFNDRYGFIRGDAMIRTLAEILRHVFAGKPNQMLGHIGGDDFILILDEQGESADELVSVLETAIVQFHSLAFHLYDVEDIQRGYFTTEGGQQHPIASVSVAVVNGSTGELLNSLMAAERAAYLKKLGKAEWGSVIVLENTPHQVRPVKTLGDLDAWRANAFAALAVLARHERGKDPHCLDAAFRAFPFFEMVFELDAQGQQRYPNWINPQMYGRIRAGGVGVDRSQLDYYTEVMRTGTPYVSPIYLSSASEDFCLTVASPLNDAAGRINGVLVADLNLSSMAALIDRRAVTAN